MKCLYKEVVDRIFTLDEPFEEMGSEAIEVLALKEEEFAQITVLGLCVSFPNEAREFTFERSVAQCVAYRIPLVTELHHALGLFLEWQIRGVSPVTNETISVERKTRMGWEGLCIASLGHDVIFSVSAINCDSESICSVYDMISSYGMVLCFANMLYGVGWHDITMQTESRNTMITARTLPLAKGIAVVFCFFDIQLISFITKDTVILQKCFSGIMHVWHESRVLKCCYVQDSFLLDTRVPLLMTCRLSNVKPIPSVGRLEMPFSRPSDRVGNRLVLLRRQRKSMNCFQASNWVQMFLLKSNPLPEHNLSYSRALLANYSSSLHCLDPCCVSSHCLLNVLGSTLTHRRARTYYISGLWQAVVLFELAWLDFTTCSNGCSLVPSLLEMTAVGTVVVFLFENLCPVGICLSGFLDALDFSTGIYSSFVVLWDFASLFCAEALKDLTLESLNFKKWLLDFLCSPNGEQCLYLKPDYSLLLAQFLVSVSLVVLSKTELEDDSNLCSHFYREFSKCENFVGSFKWIML
ncbi:hypothetical protein Tco_0507890 [Tanacetum coccineum]